MSSSSVLPDGFTVERVRNGLPGMLDPVRRYCRAKNVEFVDLMEGFLDQPADVPTDVWFVDGFHYSAEGNRIIAAWLVHELERRRVMPKSVGPGLPAPRLLTRKCPTNSCGA